MNRHLMVVTLLAITILVSSACSPDPGKKIQPKEDVAHKAINSGCPDCNVLIITIDTLRADYLPCQGHPRNIAPRICELAQKGTLFENAYSPAPSTLPALTSIFSYSMVSNNDPHDLISHYSKQTFLAEQMKAKGYKTAGFTDHFGLGRNRPSSKLLQGFDTFENFGTGRRQITADKVTNAAIEWLKQFGKTKHFMWLHYFDPHFNYNPSSKNASRFGFSSDNCGRITNGIDIEEVRKIEKELTPREVQCLSALHEAEIYATDQSIGRLLDEVEKLGLTSNTRIIVSADHGEEFLERNRIGHEWTLYNELIHVPFFVVGPGIKKSREKKTISTLEIFSLATLGRIKDSNDIFSRAHHYYRDSKNSSGDFRTRPNEFAIIQGQTKLILTPSKPVEFYDLKEDPFEKNNISNDQNAGLLKISLEKWMIENNVAVSPPSKKSIELHEQTRKKLEALGYIK